MMHWGLEPRDVHNSQSASERIEESPPTTSKIEPNRMLVYSTHARWEHHWPLSEASSEHVRRRAFFFSFFHTPRRGGRRRHRKTGRLVHPITVRNDAAHLQTFKRVEFRVFFRFFAQVKSARATAERPGRCFNAIS